MPSTPKARHRSRELLVQALYQWQLAAQPMATIEAQFCADNDVERIDAGYFHDLLHLVGREQATLEQQFAPLLDRRVDELDAISRAILLIATAEFRSRLEVPYKVVINEAINLAKRFGPTDSQKFVNGVLDKLAPRLREPEVKAERERRSAG